MSQRTVKRAVDAAAVHSVNKELKKIVGMKVSIILATWNRADLLHIPIESCLAQTYENWDLWVMDDASTDNTEEVVKGYDDPRINYVRLEKQPYYTHVRNQGINRSDGELLAFRDSDGGWHEKFLEEMVKPHKMEDVAMTYCGRYVYQGVELAKIKYPQIRTLVPTKMIMPPSYKGPESLMNHIDVGDMVIKRSIFNEDFKGFSELKDRASYCSDAELVDQIEVYNPHMRIVKVPYYLHLYFYQHGGKVENMTDTKLRYRAEGKHENPLERLWEF